MCFRRGTHSEPFPVGLCGKECRFHGSRRLRLFSSQHSDPVPLLLGSLVRGELNPHQSAYRQPDMVFTGNFPFCVGVHNSVQACFIRGSAFEKKKKTFLRLSDYKRTSVQDEDNDVAAERQRIYDGGSKTDILQIRDLSKVKPNKHPSVCFVTDLFSFESLVLYSIFIVVWH